MIVLFLSCFSLIIIHNSLILYILYIYNIYNLLLLAKVSIALCVILFISQIPMCICDKDLQI